MESLPSLQYIHNPYNRANVALKPGDVTKILAAHGIVGYKPGNLALFQQAFTHPSYVKPKPRSCVHPQTRQPGTLASCPSGMVDLQPCSYERLEFLGDKELDHVITHFVFERFPHAQEDKLSSSRAKLINNQTIGRIALSMGLNKYVLISRQFEANRMKDLVPARDSIAILSDVFEAFLGALWLDSQNSRILHDFVLGVYTKHLDVEATLAANTNYKELYQEYCTKTLGFSPKYQDIAVEQVGARCTYTVAVIKPDGTVLKQGKGSTKQDAQKEACRLALLDIQEEAEPRR